MAHAHDFQPAGHVERCADEDCLAWQPLGQGDREPEPISQPRRLGLGNARPAGTPWWCRWPIVVVGSSGTREVLGYRGAARP